MDYKKMIEERNRANYFANSIGARIAHLEEGKAIVELDVEEKHRNPIHAVHGGVLYTLADNASGIAAAAYGSPATTLDYSFHYLRPALEDVTHVTATATTIKRGKRSIVLNVEVCDQDGNLLAVGIATHMVIELEGFSVS